MRPDRAEWTGTGAALLFHVALIGALSMSLANVDSTPEPPAMEVEFVEDVGLTAAAPQSIAVPPPPSQAPEIGEAEPVEAPPIPQPPPRPAPSPVVKPSPQRPAPSPVAKPSPPRPAAPTKPPPRASRIGDDFLKGIGEAPSKTNSPPKPAAATFSTQARASVGQAILRQVQPCADRQPFIGEDANQVRLKVNLKLARSGRLTRPPTILGMSGDPDLRAKYGDLLEDQVRRIFAQCTPLRLPAELYDTPDGGWNDFTFTYRVN